MTSEVSVSTDPEQTGHLAAYIAAARWFGQKGRDFEVTSVLSLPLAPGVSTVLVGVRFTEPAEGPASAGEGREALYQLPLSAYDAPQDRLQHAWVGSWGGQHHYDAVHDRDAMQVWLAAFAGTPDGGQDPRIGFTRVGDHELDLDTHSTLFSGEQSNSSLAFGEDALLKVFRRIEMGSNPDIEIHEVLTRAGSSHVAGLYGYAEADLGDLGVVELAMLQQFLRTASDGWELALASVRNLARETDLLPDEAGGDFAAEAHRLGASLAEIHEVLADAFPTAHLDCAAAAAAMQRRLEAALAVVPDIAELRDALESRFAMIAEVSGQQAQRIHGDLHLGQTLRTSLGWKFVDFEGEPAKSLAERRLPDSGWRDVAGMIRSFDYAASTVARDLGGTEEEVAEIHHRASAWTAHATAAFLAGYEHHRGTAMTDADSALLRAYIADKAIYEAVYEARNRPGWLPIPLAALYGIALSPA